MYAPEMWPMGRGELDPTYVTSNNFREFVAFGLASCWLSGDPDDPNANCFLGRPVTIDDVTELRGYFLDTMEVVIHGLWNHDFKPGDGELDLGSSVHVIDTEENGSGSDAAFLGWYARLDDDAMMVELNVTGSDPEVLWLSYDTLHDRKNVIKVLTEACRYTFEPKVWHKLLQSASA